MRVLVYEHLTAGGRLGDDPPSPALVREGAAMLAALAADLSRAGHAVLVPCPEAFPPVALRGRLPARVELLRPGGPAEALAEGLRRCDAAWIIAPETGGCLAALARAALEAGRRLLGPSPAAIATASSKLATFRALRSARVPAIPTLPLEAAGRAFDDVAQRGIVVKPDDGVGGEGLRVVRSAAALRELSTALRPHVVQPLVPGRAASVCVLAAGGRALPLGLQSQAVRLEPAFRYRGGRLPLRDRRAGAALRVAREAVLALDGLEGLVGVDLVLAAEGPVVVEVNPRLTTAYLGLRRAFRENLAATAVAVLDGAALPERLEARRRRVVFRPSGRVRVLPPPRTRSGARGAA